MPRGANSWMPTGSSANGLLDGWRMDEHRQAFVDSLKWWQRRCSSTVRRSPSSSVKKGVPSDESLLMSRSLAWVEFKETTYCLQKGMFPSNMPNCSFVTDD